MPTIDVQVHCYERNHPGRPWHAVLTGPPEVTGEDMIKAMNSVGVDGALLISVHTMYRWDASYAVSVRKAHPDKFALIKPVDPNDPKVADTIAEWAKIDGTVAIRIMMNDEVMGSRSAQTLGGCPISYYVYVDDADAAFKKAIAAGAKQQYALTDMFWGDRMGTLEDPFGYKWTIAQHVKDVSPEQMKKGQEEFMKQMASSH